MYSPRSQAYGMTETNSVAVIIAGDDYTTRPGSTLVFVIDLALICIDPLIPCAEVLLAL